jgi:ribosomal protein S18 acetylase RimI-like enzyme
MIDGAMSEPEIRVRPATRDDFEAIERIAAANDEPTTAPRWPGWLYLDHLLAEAALLVAERDGAILGYAGAAVVGGRHPAAHITDLFVAPAAHGQGAGRHLLRDLLLAVEVTAWTTSSSSDPRAMALYVRAGLRPLWPILYLDAPLHLPVLDVAGDWWAGRAHSRAVDPGAASALESEWSGRDFAVQYRHWAARPGGVTFTVEADRRTVAVGAVRDGRNGPGRVLDHLAIAPGVDPSAAVQAALRSEAVRDPERTIGDDLRLRLAVAGPSPALPDLLAVGVRVTDHDTFGATDPRLVDPARVVPDPSFG